MSKSAIYAAYGITYKAGKITLPDGTTAAPLLKRGNAKLAKGVFTWSMAPVYSCPSCRKYGCGRINPETGKPDGTCYAIKAYKMYPTCKAAWDRNFTLAAHHGEWLRNALIAQIKADNATMVRVHVAGEFFRSDYVAMWAAIASACPDVRFWTYTKSYGVSAKLDSALDALKALPNFNIVDSTPCGRKNYGSAEYLSELVDELLKVGKQSFICPCAAGNDGAQCGTACTACATMENVLFLEH